jgi:hypothetical protein
MKLLMIITSGDLVRKQISKCLEEQVQWQLFQQCWHSYVEPLRLGYFSFKKGDKK